MNQTTKIVLGVAGVAVAAFLATGVVPDSPVGGTCYVSWAVGPCDAAVALSAGDVVCESGTEVTLPVEVVGLDGTDAGEPLALPSGFIPIIGESREVSCASLTRGAKSLTVVPLSKYVISADGGTACPPVSIAGHEPPGC